MKKLSLMLCVLLGAIACRSEEAKAPVAHKPAALVALGEVEPALMERLKNWAQDNLAVEVPLAPAETNAVESLQAAVDWGAKRVGESEVGLVVVVNPSGPVMNHGVYAEKERVAVVNVKAMKADDPDAEKLARRLERQVMRSLGLLYGLDMSPNPLSAMSHYGTLAELDQIGRNFDPPWLVKFQERAVELGIPLNTDCPLYMLR